MKKTAAQLQTALMREYYTWFSKYAKGKRPEKKVAWVTAFTPVEILEALDMLYYYPESYAAVIAASEKEQDLLNESERQYLSRDCCSYSCCIEGCLQLENGPRGILPVPDILIATNNHCNTLPNWWNILAERYQVPLIVIDYPGDIMDQESAFDYVDKQHKKLIKDLETLTGKTMDYDKLRNMIANSQNSVSAWNSVISCLPVYEISPTDLFDGISFLITSRCKEATAELYRLMYEKLKEKPAAAKDQIPVFWLGYPLWYHPQRYLQEVLTGYRIAGSNYITWWSIDYFGNDSFERLFHAYNYTFLNLSQENRNKRLEAFISESGAVCAITLHNKSCKCDFVSAKNISIPQVEIEIDMIDRQFLDISKVKKQMDIQKDVLCSI